MSFFISDSSFYSILNAMNQTSYQQQISMLRLTTGYRINSAADDPSGLVAISALNSDLVAVQAAYENGTRANAMLSVADGAVDEISDLVSDIYSLTVELANDSGLTDDEKAAKQLEIDQAIASIDNIVNTTTFNGQHLLNGTYAINTTGVDSSKITDVDITSRPVGTNTNLQLDVVSAAEQGQITFSGAGLGKHNPVTLEITGNLGSVQLSFAASTSIEEMASSINANTTSTGVQAVASNDVLYMQSEEYGEDQFVTVHTISGSFHTTDDVTTDYGEDATVTINGQNAEVDGYNVTFNVNGVSGRLTLAESFVTTAGGSDSFTVTDGGATFSLSPSVSNTATIGISSLSSAHLGNGIVGYLSQITSGGEYNATDNATQAMKIAREAVTQVARASANIGAFQSYTITSTQNALSDAETALSSAISSIRDTDYALEMANLTRQNALYQAQINSLSILSQQTSSLVNLFSNLF